MNLCPTILDNKRATLKPAEFVQPLDKGGRPLRPTYRRARAQKPEDWKLPTLLRMGRERPRHGAAEKRDERAPFPLM